MEREYTVRRAADGSLEYDGPSWSELSDDERTARIKECYTLKYCTYEEIARAFRIFRPGGKGNGDVIRNHLAKFRVEHPKIAPKPPTPKSARRNAMSFSGPKLSGNKLLAKIREQKESGKAFVAKSDQESVPRAEYLDELRKQKGFCVALLANGDYCGEECEGNLCEKHKNRGRNLGKTKAPVS